MNRFSMPAAELATPPRPNAAELLRRKPKRITTVVSWRTFQLLQTRADLEGRSLSNLSAFLLERGLVEDLPEV